LVIDHAMGVGRHDFFTIAALGVALIAATQIILSFARAAMLLRVQREVDTGLSMSFISHLLSLPYRFFDHRSTGDLLARTSAIAEARNVMTSQLIASIIDGTLAVTYIAILASRDRAMAGLVLAVAALHATIVVLTRTRMHEAIQRQLSAAAAEQSALVE